VVSGAIAVTTSTMDAAVRTLVGPVMPFQPGQKLTTFANWFTTPADDKLVLAVRPGLAPNDTATAVAHALSWQGHRELVLLLPDAAVASATARLAYVATPLQIWAVDDALTPTPTPIPTVETVVAAASNRPLRGEPQHDLGAFGPWVNDLVASTDRHWALVDAHRGNYLSWHCAGRQVLKLTRTGTGVRVQAGVQYSNPPAGRQPYDRTATAPLTEVERAEAEAAIAVAVADRLTGRDADHVEHRMQATLGRTGLSELGLVELAREYPSWRADGAPGFIDFLGLDGAGQLHIIETKIGSDDMLVFQVLDYLSWVTAHASAIRADRGWPAGDDSVVHIDFVLAPKTGARPQPALGPYTAGQLAALREDVAWRIHLIDDAHAGAPVIHSYRPRQVPPPRPGVVAAPIC
jgi:hypothetical protein